MSFCTRCGKVKKDNSTILRETLKLLVDGKKLSAGAYQNLDHAEGYERTGQMVYNPIFYEKARNDMARLMDQYNKAYDNFYQFVSSISINKSLPDIKSLFKDTSEAVWISIKNIIPTEGLGDELKVNSMIQAIQDNKDVQFSPLVCFAGSKNGSKYELKDGHHRLEVLTKLYGKNVKVPVIFEGYV